MNIDQLRAFANSDEQHINKLALTREAARAIVAEHDREVAKNLDAGFEIPERDDGKHAARMFGVFAKAEADFQRELELQAEDARGCL